MKKLLVLSFLVASLSSSFAELTASHTAAVEKLLTVMETEKVLQIPRRRSQSRPRCQRGADQSSAEGAAGQVQGRHGESDGCHDGRDELGKAQARSHRGLRQCLSPKKKPSKSPPSWIHPPANSTSPSRAPWWPTSPRSPRSRMKDLMPKLMQIMQEEMQK
jgi:hypothetical protein